MLERFRIWRHTFPEPRREKSRERERRHTRRLNGSVDEEKIKIELLEAFWPMKPSQEAVDGILRDSEWQACHSGKNKMD